MVSSQNVRVESDADLFAVLAYRDIGFSFVTDKDLRNDVFVEVPEVGDLSCDLAFRRGVSACAEPIEGKVVGRFDPSFIHDAFVLFLQFHEDHVFGAGVPVTSDADLFFIDRFVQRFADQTVVFCVEVDVADRGQTVIVDPHPAGDRFFYFGTLLSGQCVF